MKITYNWLSSFIKFNTTFENFIEILSSIGLEVEKILDKERIYSQFIIAEIVEIQRHPDADKLKICIVNNGKEHLQIVSAAQNVRPGIKVVLAPVGSIIPQNNMVIKGIKIRGVGSHSMLCSEAELLLGNNSDNIMEIIGENAIIGESFAIFAGLDDKKIDISLTPNRGDCASIYGIARDLAAAGVGDLSSKFNKITLDFKGSLAKFNPSIKDKKACQEIAFCYIKNVDNTSVIINEITSKFNLLDIKLHTPLVDISNFAMYEYGRPNHMYDVDKIDGNIVIRLSKKGEPFTSLEDIKYNLPPGILVIADDKKILSIAGVVGGNSSRIDKNTKNILIEVANFHPEQIAKSTRALNIKTESSFRFERRVDYGNTQFFMQYIVDLIQKYCTGKIVGSMLLKGEDLKYIKQVKLNYNEIEKILGIKIEHKTVDLVLEKLGFIKEKNTRLLNIPTWRQGDIVNIADIAEEVIRMVGGKGTKSKDYFYSSKDLKFEVFDFSELFRDILTNRNINEVISWSFINQESAELFIDKPFLPLLKLANPISNEFAIMRGNIIPGLLQIVKNNISMGYKDLSFFEIGKIFSQNKAKEVFEENCLAIIRMGNAVQKQVLSKQRKFDFYDLKDDLYSLLSEINVSENDLLIKKGAQIYYHTDKSASLYIDKKLIAFIGELHPKIIKQFGLKKQLYCAEIFYNNLPKKNLDKRAPLFLSELQSIDRDFAFFIDNEIESIELLKAVRSLKIDIIDAINIFDVYKDDKVDENKKSIAFNVKLQPREKTLVEEEIEAISAKIINVITKKLGAELRDK